MEPFLFDSRVLGNKQIIIFFTLELLFSVWFVHNFSSYLRDKDNKIGQKILSFTSMTWKLFLIWIFYLEMNMSAIRCLHSLSRSVQLLRTTFQVIIYIYLSRSVQLLRTTFQVIIYVHHIQLYRTSFQVTKYISLSSPVHCTAFQDYRYPTIFSYKYT